MTTMLAGSESVLSKAERKALKLAKKEMKEQRKQAKAPTAAAAASNEEDLAAAAAAKAEKKKRKKEKKAAEVAGAFQLRRPGFRCSTSGKRLFRVSRSSGWGSS
jgi:hypothetical protein